MEYYSIMPEDCVYAPQDLISACGSLYPYITSLSGAKKYARSVKKQFPEATINLFKGETWGEMELVETF